MFEKIKKMVKHLGFGLGNIAIVLLVWVITVGMWNFLVRYPITTMSILAGVPAAIAIYYTAKDQIHAYKRGN